MVANARKVLDATAANQHHAMLLEVMPLTRNIAGDLDPVGQTHTRDLTKSGVRLLGGGRVHACAHPTLLRAPLEGRSVGLFLNLKTSLDRKSTRLNSSHV